MLIEQVKEKMKECSVESLAEFLEIHPQTIYTWKWEIPKKYQKRIKDFFANYAEKTNRWIWE